MLKSLICSAALTAVFVCVPHIAVAQNALSYTSADKAHSVALKSVVQVDFGTYSQSDDLSMAIPEAARNLEDGSNLRRARMGIAGKVFSDFDYAVSFDYGGSSSDMRGRLFEAWTQYTFSDAAKLRAGWFTPNVGLSDAGSSSASPLMERAAVADMARNVAGGDTRLAAVVSGNAGRAFYVIGVSGSTLGKPDTQGQSALIARAAFLPVKSEDWLVHVGINGQFVLSVPDAPLRLRERPELRVDETRLIDAGAMSADGLNVYGLEFAVQHKNLFVQSEAFQFRLERDAPSAGVSHPRFSGAYIEGGWVITGEARKYNTGNAAFDGVKPARPFNPQSGDWGAWELTARYSVLDLDWHADATLPADRVRGGRQEVMALGLGWTLNSSLRVVAQAQSVDIDRWNAVGEDIGQEFTAFGLRTQISF